MKIKNILLKYFIFFTVLAFFKVSSVSSSSLSPTSGTKYTPTPEVSAKDITNSPTGTVIDKLKKIETLKEKIATKVAEIREKDKAALYGNISKIDKNTLTITTSHGDQIVTYSDDTVFYSIKNGTRSDMKPGALKEKDSLTTFGYLDSGNTNLSAKYIYVEIHPVKISGKVSDLDKSNYTVSVKTKQGNLTVDYETFSKTYIFDTNKKKFVPGGFSKIKVADTVHIIADPNPKDQTKFTARKIYTMTIGGEKLTPAPSSNTPTPTIKIPTATPKK